jgi:hypothetical protein
MPSIYWKNHVVSRGGGSMDENLKFYDEKIQLKEKGYHAFNKHFSTANLPFIMKMNSCFTSKSMIIKMIVSWSGPLQ